MRKTNFALIEGEKLTIRMNGDQEERAEKWVAVSSSLGRARSSWRVMRGVRLQVYFIEIHTKRNVNLDKKTLLFFPLLDDHHIRRKTCESIANSHSVITYANTTKFYF